MEWVLRSPQIHSTFSNLGFLHTDGYHINDNCNSTLESILHNILTEDKYLRTYRLTISVGRNIQKDLIPLLLHAKEDKTIELLVKILVNLTIPIECLLSVEVISQSDFGRTTVFEINNLLASTKAAFTDIRVTKVIIDFLMKNIYAGQQCKIAPEQCTNISNSLLLLRNILHIPEIGTNPCSGNNGFGHAVQNQILWNIFSQSIDKILIKLMTVPEASNWGITMVQLIALLYKDQHVCTLHKLLNLWLETGLSESSEDNESNTTPPDRGSEDSSPMLTSEPTSDSSDTDASGKSNDEPNSENIGWGSENNTSENGNQPFRPPLPHESHEGDIHMTDRRDEAFNNDDHMKCDNEDKVISESPQSKTVSQQKQSVSEKKTIISENSDCGYGTQIENHGSVSTSSNDDEIPAKKPLHQKPHNPKQRKNSKARTGLTLLERKRKKIVKRGKANIVNVQGLTHKTPTDDDISNLLKEFTVDFLLKGYNALVRTLHRQILTNIQLEIDTSHFFWLVTYFLKFATQIELDLEQISSVLSYDIVSYLTAEGVYLCEDFELAIKLDGNNLKPSIRRHHLVVTAIREFIQALQVYKKYTHICADDQRKLVTLQNKMCESDELRSLLVLLLRHYNPKYQTKQYLQDLIVTNHILLLFVDSAIKDPEYTGPNNMLAHIQQFATPEIMYRYGLLLEDYASNGEFVNDCIFTMMHHVGGELSSLICLYQPKILKTFTSIWKSEFEICDDWSDLIEYVINTFIKKPHTLQRTSNFRLDTENFDDDLVKKSPSTIVLGKEENQITELEKLRPGRSSSSNASNERWTEEELSSLSWNYLKYNTLPDVVGEIVKSMKEEGTIKSRDSVLKKMLNQNIINKELFEKLSKGESDRNSKIIQINKEIRDDQIGKLCEQLKQDGKIKCFEWVQKVLLETCFAKLYLKKSAKEYLTVTEGPNILQFKLFNQEFNDLPVMSSVSYHSLLLNRSVPLVPWNCEQAAMCKDLRFLQLMHKLGFQMPVDTGKVFIRIPHFWPAEILYEVAGRVAAIDTTKLKFFVTDISDSGSGPVAGTELAENITVISTLENFYQIHKQKHLATMVNFTPIIQKIINSTLLQRPRSSALPDELVRRLSEAKPSIIRVRQSLLRPRPGSAFDSECVQNDEPNRRCWLQVVQQSQEIKLSSVMGSMSSEGTGSGQLPTAPPASPAAPADLPKDGFHSQVLDLEDNNSVCETASVASDLTRMYVSDEDEKSELQVRPRVKVEPLSAMRIMCPRSRREAPRSRRRQLALNSISRAPLPMKHN